MLIERLTEALGAEAVKTSPEDLACYSFDAYSQGVLPSAVVLPTSAAQVSAVVKIARDLEEPLIARGSGTGLCGGATPLRAGIVLSFARMNQLLELDIENRRARVAPGLVNLQLSERIASTGYFYAPDPASQRASTIGGNIGTNAGGPHCLAYGTTVNHVLALEIVDDRGECFTTAVDDLGYDLTALLVGSEGTLGIVTSAWVRLLRIPPATGVWLAAFPSIESASEAVSAIVGAGIVPTALEMMDATIVRAVESAYAAGYPEDAAAVLLVESSGEPEEVASADAAIARIARAHSATKWQAATSAEQRDALWRGRKGAAGAVGRIAPNYYTQDVCVPRTRLPEMLAAVDDAARRHEIVVGNVFHAGDGNLHPLLLYDKRDARQVAAVIEIGNIVLARAVELGGTISGEHGVGIEKRNGMSLVYRTEDLAAMACVRDVFDPQALLNPEKIFPSGISCREMRT